MSLRKIAFGATAATSVSLVGAFAFYAPKVVQAHQVEERIACDVMATQAEQSGAEYKPSLVCKIAAKL